MADPPAQDDLDLLRRRVLNVVGHELRTPVTTIRGLAERLIDDPAEPERTELGDALLRSAIRLERLVDDLLVAAGVHTALPADGPARASVAGAADRAWRELTDEPLAVEGDADVAAAPLTVSRMLGALLDNARKYGAGAVTVRVVPEGDVVAVEVVSPGATLSEADAALASEPFYRGESAVPVASGLGLGLAVAGALARQHGGDVSLGATPSGVVARLELPSAR